ncbi:MAG: glycosyltransferase involved in cell wall biosynthesis, partial [Myxococcota bacterium]
MRATVLIPAFEEGPRIAAVLRAARAALPAADLLVVDGGSTDDTAAVAAGEGARVI